METISLAEEAPAPAPRIWAILADFGGFLDWAHTHANGTIEVEGDGVGMIRHLDMGTGRMGERLDRLDHESRTLTYSLAYGEPLGMDRYRARVRVEELEEGRSLLHWTGEYSSSESEKLAAIGATLTQVYAGFTQALAAYANRTPP